MSLAGMQEAWPPFRARVDAVYELARSSLREGVSLDLERWEALPEVLDGALAASELVRREAEDALEGGEEYQPVSHLLLAAATVDAMLASDIAALDPELSEYRPGTILEGQANFADVDAERQEVLDAADELFRGPMLIAGAQSIPDRNVLLREVNGITDELVDHAVDCGGELVQGLFSLAGGEIASVVAHADLVPRLDLAAARIINRSPRFCREHVRKVLTLTIPQGAEWFFDQVGGVFAQIGLRSILVRVADVADAKMEAGAWITGVADVAQQDADRLMDKVAALERGYRSQTKWIRRAASWLRRGAAPLSHLITPVVGPGVVAGVFVLGIAYDAYSLTDRLDARDLRQADLIVGVVKLVKSLPE